jgi:hypothetical protein
MDVDINSTLHAVPMQVDTIHPVPMHPVPMHIVPKHVTFMKSSLPAHGMPKYIAPAQVAHYVYSNSMIIDEHPNKVILR